MRAIVVAGCGRWGSRGPPTIASVRGRLPGAPVGPHVTTPETPAAAAAVAGPIWRAANRRVRRIADSIEDEVADAPGWTLLPVSHAGAYQRCPRTLLVAAGLDPYPERLARFGARLRLVDRLYPDYREMLERETPYVVSVCVPTRGAPRGRHRGRGPRPAGREGHLPGRPGR